MSDAIEVIHGTIINSDDRRADKVNELHQLFLDSMNTGIEYAYQCGVELITIKESLRFGDWETWVKANCNFSYRKARSYMQIASKWQRAAILENGTSIRKALALLAEPKPKKEKEIVEKDWSVDSRVVDTMDWLKEIRATTMMLITTNKNRSSADYYLRMIQESMVETLLYIAEHWDKNNKGE
jgi:hypothetical protein